MAKIVFQSNEAKDHFAKVVEHAILNDTYFSERGLHGRLEYLRQHGDKGEKHVRQPDGTIMEYRIMLGIGYTVHEVNLMWQSRTYVFEKGKNQELCWTQWITYMWGGLIGHSSGEWGTHT